MTAILDRFPVAELAETDISHVAALCGEYEDRPPQEDDFRNFLRYSGLPALPESTYRRYLRDLGMKCLRILGFEEEALHCFNRGILTYAATVYEIGGVLPLPHDLEAMNAVEHSEDMTGIADSALHSIKSFEQLLQRLAPILQKEQAGLEIAQIGAGVLHAITIESLLKPAVQQEVVTEDHAEAALLRALDMELTELSVPHEEGSGEADEGGASINPIVTIDAMPPFPLGLTRIVETDKRRDGLRYEEATRPTFKLDK